MPGATGKLRTFDQAELDRFKAAEAEKALATTYVARPRGVAPVASDAPSPQALQRQASVEGMQAFALMVADALREAQTPQSSIPAVPLADKLTLTIDDAARLSGLSANHIRGAIHDGTLKARIVGRGWKIAPDALKAYVGKVLK